MALIETITKPATGVLFEKLIPKVKLNGKELTPCAITSGRSDARGPYDSMPPKHSNILFALREVYDGGLKVGYVDKTGPYLLEANITREDGSPYVFKAIVNLDCENGKSEKGIDTFFVKGIRITTDADETHWTLVYAYFILVFAMVNTDEAKFQITYNAAIKDKKITEENTALAVFEDSIYYDMKYRMLANDGKNVDVVIAREDNADTIDNGISKANCLKPVKVPKNMEYVANGATYLPVFERMSKPGGATDPVREMSELYAKIKAGLYRRNDEFAMRFPQDAQNDIPPLEYLEGYVPSKEFFTLLNLCYIQTCEAFGVPYGDVVPTVKTMASEMNPGNVLNALLFGPPGTGKSTMPHAIAAAIGIPYRNVTCSPENDENSFNLQIMFGDNGDMHYFEQPFRVAYRQGGIIVCEEVNLARPDILQGVFSGALDDTYRIGNMRTDKTTPEGMGYANRAASTICMFTCNPGAAGTKLQNTAFYSRIATWIELSEIKKEDLFAMVKAKYKDVDTEAMNLVYDIFEQLRNDLKDKMDEMKEYQDLLSPRAFRYCIGQYMNGVQLRDAIMSTMMMPLRCLVQEKGEDTFNEFDEKIFKPMRGMIDVSSDYDRQRQIKLLT